MLTGNMTATSFNQTRSQRGVVQERCSVVFGSSFIKFMGLSANGWLNRWRRLSSLRYIACANPSGHANFQFMTFNSGFRVLISVIARPHPTLSPGRGLLPGTLLGGHPSVRPIQRPDWRKRRQPSANPKGIPAQSPGLRACELPWVHAAHPASTATRLRRTRDKILLCRSAAVSETSRSNVACNGRVEQSGAAERSGVAAAGFQHSRAPASPSNPMPGAAHNAKVSRQVCGCGGPVLTRSASGAAVAPISSANISCW